MRLLGECVPGEPVVHAVCVASGRMITAVTTRHLFTVEVESGQIRVVGEVPGRGHLGQGRTAVFGQDEGERLWRFEVTSGHISRGTVHLPAGDWTSPLRWTRDQSGLLYTADAAGQLFSFDENRGFRLIGRAHLASVGPMAVDPDGRLFGFCGAGIANLFSCDTLSGRVTNLGVAASVLERRRYGYEFGDAVTGSAGEIVFGEDDNGGHLWLYFPKITAQPR